MRTPKTRFQLPAENYEMLVNAVVDYAIYMLSPEGHVISWNSGAERIKGYHRDDILGEHFSCFFTEEDRAAGKPDRALSVALRDGRFLDEGWRLRKDGSRFWALTVLDTVYDKQGKLIGLAKITRDITERREAQQRLDEAREQLMQAQKLEALGQFTGGLAHDFNNLLTIIRGATDLGARQTTDPRLLRQLETIRTAVDSGASITRRLLDFARRQPLQTQLIEPSTTLQNTLQLLRQSLHNDIKLTSDIAPNLPPVRVDPSLLELSLLNLTINARDAIAQTGSIHLSAYPYELNGELDELHGQFVAIALRDDGSGIPPELCSRIFEPFFTTKQFGKGTGLGLSQVYGFARQSSGTVQVQSTPGHGTTVTLYLPVDRAGSRRAEEASDSDAKRILLVEDDQHLAVVAGDMLEMMGFDVIIAHSANEALQLINRLPRIDLLFSDIVMPGGTNGLELANHIRERRPELPILLASGFSNAQQKDALIYPLLDKPYTYEKLADALQELL
ncbi:PAS domain-containing sensor histidine kinase [Stutzerimonas nitrititolerans]|uniref:PAS domain-containing sensor histidine kinase n=1 Tax=Stutzerimonas nitrititolerans TaxID=2482751 RepID=UPI0028A6075D|nr:ATP-binding protein [Stutzerimonas nitrititolerans]